LTSISTLFYYARTVLRALAWDFPNDASLEAADMQFMLGPSPLVTPVLE
jgi:alpha-glucosidase